MHLCQERVGSPPNSFRPLVFQSMGKGRTPRMEEREERGRKSGQHAVKNVDMHNGLVCRLGKITWLPSGRSYVRQKNSAVLVLVVGTRCCKGQGHAGLLLHTSGDHTHVVCLHDYHDTG